MKKSIKNLEVNEIKEIKTIKGGDSGKPSPLYEIGFVPVHPIVASDDN